MSSKRLKWTRRERVRRYLIWPLQGAAFSMVLSLFAALPRRPAASLGRALAGFVGPRLSRQHARAIGRNVAIAFPAITEADAKTVRRRICAHFGQVLSTYAHLPSLLSRNGFGGIVDVEGANHLAEAVRSGPFRPGNDVTDRFAPVAAWLSKLQPPSGAAWGDKEF